MNFTFGIITDGNYDHYISNIIQSIHNNNIPNYEIIIVGNTHIQENNKIKIIKFNESQKNKWITRKKNIIAINAKYENIVMLHDYIQLSENWYNGFLNFGNDFDWCISKITNANGERFRDYTLFPYEVDYLNINYSPGKDINEYFNCNCLLPYDFVNSIQTNKYLYISGSYYVIKKKVATKYFLDENLLHCQGEDVEYSKRLHLNGIIIKCNKYSDVILLKQKQPAIWEHEISHAHLQMFIDYCRKN